MFVTSGVSSATREYVERVWRTNDRLGRFCFLTALRLMILLMSFYHLKSCFSNQFIKINEFFLSLELWFEDICLSFKPIMTFCDTKKDI